MFQFEEELKRSERFRTLIENPEMCMPMLGRVERGRDKLLVDYEDSESDDESDGNDVSLPDAKRPKLVNSVAKQAAIRTLSKYGLFSTPLRAMYANTSISLSKFADDEFQLQGVGIKSKQWYETDMLKKMWDAASVSGFGDVLNNQNVVDETVRRARELVDDDKISWPGRETSELRHKLNELACAHWSRTDCEHRLLKVTLYEEGGHFKDHVDHLIDPNMIGTCVCIIGPSVLFKDGDFYIRQSDWDKNAEFTEVWPDSVTDPFVQVIHFDPRTPHKVGAVKSGIRVALTFAVIASSSIPSSIIPTKSHSEFNDALRTVVLENKESVGLVLMNKYSPSSNFEVALDHSDRTMFDNVVDWLASEHRVSPKKILDEKWVYFQPCLIVVECPCDVVNCEHHGNNTKDCNFAVYRLSDELANDWVNNGICSESKKESVIVIINDEMHGNSGIFEETKPCYFAGNDVEQGKLTTVYVLCVLVIDATVIPN